MRQIIYYLNLISFIVLVMCSAISCRMADNNNVASVVAPAAKLNGQADPWQVIDPFWRSKICWRESMLFIKKQKDALPEADLLFIPSKVICVRNARGDQDYEIGRDYVISPASRRISLPKGSRIPYKEIQAIYLRAGDPNSIRHKTGDPNTALFWGEGRMYQDLQIEISYEHQGDSWTGYRPACASQILPKTFKKLKAKQPFKICMCGDSISCGANASGVIKSPPLMPPYGTLVADYLGKIYGCQITLRNFAIGGMSAAAAKDDIAKVNSEHPDLVIFAYGMNDVHNRNPDLFKMQVSNFLRETKNKNPELEYLIISPMLGNPEWAATPADQFPLYQAALKQLTGQGIALADMTSLWSDILQHKSFFDLTGNGVNHPNDFGHRLYAQVCLGLLVE
jgi:acyl-CoA thioesterase I